MSQVIAFVLAFLIGVTLGLLGGGGSILTVPVLVYVLRFEPKDAIAMSFPIVAATSLAGALGHWRSGNVDRRALLTFAPLAMIGAVAGARLAAVVAGETQLLILGVVMLMAGGLMITDNRREPAGLPTDRSGARLVVLTVSGMGVGVLTGLVGVGGGFLIVPALTLLAGVPIKRAIGTSLVVISLSTVTGLAGHTDQADVDWLIVAGFGSLAVVGAVVGTRVARRASPAALRRAFGALVLAVGALLVYHNAFGTQAAERPTSAADVRR